MADEQKKSLVHGDKTTNSEMFCDLCNISFSTEQELKEHVWSLMHHIKMEHRKKGSVHTCTLCYTTCADLKEYGTHMYLDKHLRALDQEKQEAQAAMEARLSARSKSPQRSEQDYNDYQNQESSNQVSSSTWPSQVQPQQKNRFYHRNTGGSNPMRSPPSHRRPIPLLKIQFGSKDTSPDQTDFHDHSNHWNDLGSNCVYAGFKRHAYQPGNRRFNMQTDQERFWQDDVWGWNQFTSFGELGPPNIFAHGPPPDHEPQIPSRFSSPNNRPPGQMGRPPGQTNKTANHTKTSVSKPTNSKYKLKNNNITEPSQNNENGKSRNKTLDMDRSHSIERVGGFKNRSRELSQKVKRDTSVGKKPSSLEERGRASLRLDAGDKKKQDVLRSRSSRSTSHELEKRNLRSLSKEKKRNVHVSIETDKTSGVRKVSVTSVDSIKRSDVKTKKVAKSSRLRKSSLQDHNSSVNTCAKKDRGAALLEEAERLCMSLRQKREEAKMMKERSLKDKEVEEKNLLDDEISALSEKSKTCITGMISEEACKKYAPSKIFSEAKESESEFPNTSKRDSRSKKGVTSEQSKEYHETFTKIDAVTSTGNELIDPNDNTIDGKISKEKENEDIKRHNGDISMKSGDPSLISDNPSRELSSKASCTSSNMPLVSKNKGKNIWQRIDLLDKDQLMKLVNSPRSRKERLQLSQMLRSHSKSQQKTMNHPRFSTQVTLSSGKEQEDLNAFNLHQLPYEVKLQIAELIEKDLQPDSQDSESESNEKVVNTRPSEAQSSGKISIEDLMDTEISLEAKKESFMSCDAEKNKTEFEDTKPDITLISLDMSDHLTDPVDDASMTLSELTYKECLPKVNVSETEQYPLDVARQNDICEVTKARDSGLNDEKIIAQTSDIADKKDPSNRETLTIGGNSQATLSDCLSSKPVEIDYTELKVSERISIANHGTSEDPDCVVISDITKPTVEDIEITSSPECFSPSYPVIDQSIETHAKVESSKIHNISLNMNANQSQTTQSAMAVDIPASDVNDRFSVVKGMQESSSKIIKKEKDFHRENSSESENLFSISSLTHLQDTAEVITSPSGAKRKKPLSPVLTMNCEKQETSIDYKRPKIEQGNFEMSSVGYESSMSSHSVLETSMVSGLGRQHDCVDQVLKLSLREESVRDKLANVNNTIDRLHSLLQQTQQQLERYIHARDKLIKEEEDLRTRRISILRGAVAEKNTPTRGQPSKPDATHRNTSMPSPIVIDLCNVKEERPSPPADPVVQTLKFEADSTSLDPFKGYSCAEPTPVLQHRTVSLHDDDDKSRDVLVRSTQMSTEKDSEVIHSHERQGSLGCQVQPKEESITAEYSQSDLHCQPKEHTVKNEPASETIDKSKISEYAVKFETDKEDIESSRFQLTDEGILRSCSDAESDKLGTAQRSQLSNDNERLMMKYVRTIESPSVTNSDVLKKLAQDISDDLGSSSYMYVEENQLLSDQEKVEEHQTNANNVTDDTSIFKDVSLLSQDQIDVNTSQNLNISGRSGEVNMSENDDKPSTFKKPAVPPRCLTASGHKNAKGTADLESYLVTSKPPVRGRKVTTGQTETSAAENQLLKHTSSTSSEDSQTKKKLKSKKQRDLSSSLTSLTSITEDSSSDSNINDAEMNIPLSELSGRKRRQRRTAEQMVLKTHLHADSSSDVDMEGLEVQPMTSTQQSAAAEGDPVTETDTAGQDKELGNQLEESFSTDDDQSDADSLCNRKFTRGNSQRNQCTPNKFSPDTKIFEGHSMSVYSMQIYDGALYTCSEDMTARKFDLNTGECQMIYQGHSKMVHCLLVCKVAKLGDRLFTGGYDNLLIAFDPKTGQCLARCRYADKVNCLCEGWNKLFIGLANGVVLIFHPGTNRTLDAFKCSERAITALSVGREGVRNLLCVASGDTIITIRDAQSGLLLRTLEGPTKPVMSIQVMKNIIYSGCGDKKLYVHNLNTGEMLACREDHFSSVSCVRVTCKLLLTAGYDGMVRVYNAKNHIGSCLQVYHGNSAVTSMLLYDSQIFSGNRYGVIEAIPMSLEHNYKCQWMDCDLVFAWRKHLQDHALKTHVLLTSGKMRCLWQGCSEWIYTQNDNNEVAAEHIAKHLNDDFARKALMDAQKKN